MSEKRYQPVSDLPEWTVVDTWTGKDMFPTTTGNRTYNLSKCDQERAEHIAEALEWHDMLIDHLMGKVLNNATDGD